MSDARPFLTFLPNSDQTSARKCKKMHWATCVNPSNGAFDAT